MNRAVMPGPEHSTSLGNSSSGGHTPNAQDRAVTALILGIAGMMWFGWGQAQPPGS